MKTERETRALMALYYAALGWSRERNAQIKSWGRYFDALEKLETQIGLVTDILDKEDDG